MSREREQGQPRVGVGEPYTDHAGRTFYLGVWPNVFNFYPNVSPPVESLEDEARRLDGGEPRAVAHGEHIRGKVTQEDIEAYNQGLANQLRGRLLLESSDPQTL